MFRSTTFQQASRGRRRRRDKGRGFTLVEVLVSVTILLMMLLIMTQVIGTAQKSWHGASARVTQFREARAAFDTVSRGLRQATINPYRDFYYTNKQTPGVPPPEAPLAAPQGYTQCADLGIRMGQAPAIFTGWGSSTSMPGQGVLFIAPMGNVTNALYRPLNSLLCMCGYFVAFDTDINYLPTGLVSRLQPRSRFRLYQYLSAAEYNLVSNQAAAGARGTWATSGVSKSIAQPYTNIVAENIVALILAPSFSTSSATGTAVPLGMAPVSSSYEFNSYTDPDTTRQYHLPTSVQVVMVAMDEESAARVALTAGTSAPSLFNANFTSPTNLANDLRVAREAMEKLKLNFRIFSSVVFLPAADK